MTYKLEELNNKNIWEEFSLNSSPNSILQSWNWGEFNNVLGHKIWRLGIWEGEKLKAILLTIKYTTRLGNYLYCPRGPIYDWQDLKIFDLFIKKLKEIAIKENCNFVRIEPSLEETSENQIKFDKMGFKRAVSFVQAEDVWLLPLKQSEDEILSGMRKTTRYLVRHEPLQGVRISVSTDQKAIEQFVDLLFSTASRKGFAGNTHKRDYYLNQFKILSKDNQEKIYIAQKDSKILSMALIGFYGEMAYYLHAASNPKQKESVGYSLQWEAIKEAKRRGCRYYNFWGVLKDKYFKPGHPWYGFSLFKRGFGGFKYTYIRAQDFPLSSKYYIYRAAEKARRLIRSVRHGSWED